MRTIPLTQGKVAIVDDSDYEWLNQVKWYLKYVDENRFYAARHRKIKGEKKTIYMHRAIMAGDLDAIGLDSKEVDHRNRNRLDNRRENLRICSKKENLENRF